MEKYDLIVIGGGFAGSAAALAAARRGMNVLLIEKSGYLGGAAANCFVYPFMVNATTINGKVKELSGGLLAEIKEKLNEMCGGLQDEYLKLLLDRMLSQANVKVLFHACLSSVKKCQDRIESVSVATRSGNMEFFANRFIDASGDAALSFLAGCDFRLGRPKDNLCQPMTTCFRVANVDIKAFYEDFERVNSLYKEKQKRNEIKNPREDILVFNYCMDNILHFNTTRVVKLNPTAPFDLSTAEKLAREQVFEIFSFIKENTESFRNASIISIAPEIGVRESRMIDGEYTLNVNDIMSFRVFEDSIACGNYDIDIHSPDGSGTSHYYFPAGRYYTIPYRSLIPKSISNLLVAGRCISCDHEAQASIRIMPIVCTLGEAAGLATVQAAQENAASMKDINIKALQQKLLENNAVIC